MKRFFAIFVLKPAEQRLVIFMLVLLVAGAWFKHYRDSRLNAPHPTQPAPSVISPSPAER